MSSGEKKKRRGKKIEPNERSGENRKAIGLLNPFFLHPPQSFRNVVNRGHGKSRFYKYNVECMYINFCSTSQSTDIMTLQAFTNVCWILFRKGCTLLFLSHPPSLFLGQPVSGYNDRRLWVFTLNPFFPESILPRARFFFSSICVSLFTLLRRNCVSLAAQASGEKEREAAL